MHRRARELIDMVHRAIVLLSVAALALSVPALAAKQYHAERFDVVLDVDRDGSLLVTETLVLRFRGGPFRQVQRTIPTRRTDGIDVVSASMDGVRWPLPDGGGDLDVDREDGRRVIWKFRAVSDSTHTFVLTYRARGVIERLADMDRFAWVALPTRHEYRIDEAIISLSWPRGARLLGPVETRPRLDAGPEGGDGATFVARDLGQRETVTLTARFAPASVTSAVPRWQVRRERTETIRPVVVALAAAIAACGLIWLLLFLNAHRRDPVRGDRSARTPAPPDDLRPSMVAALASGPSGGVWSQMFASILDLARRGVIRIEESPERKWYRSRDFGLHLVGDITRLSPYERSLIDALFTTKHGPRTMARFSELPIAVRQGWRRFRASMWDELERAGFVSSERLRSRHRLIATGIGVLILGGVGVAVAGILSDAYGGQLLLLPFSVIFAGVMVLIASATQSPLSDEGRRRAAAWRPFLDHLRDVAKGQTDALGPSDFERYLGFAVAAGVAGAWVKALRASGALATLPAWFAALASSDAGRQSDAFVHMIHTAHSHSTSSAAGGGSGGAAGGGSSSAS